MSFNERYIKARRAAIELDFDRLNPPQREAAMTTSGPLLLLAGAGSGKTTVVISRITNLLKYGSGSDSDYVPDHATQEDLDYLEAYVNNARAQRVLIESRGGDETLRFDDEEIRRLCAVDPVEPWRVIAITFTNKAAGEMKDRLERALGAEARDIWAMTFHSACARILRRDIDRLGYSSSFTIYDSSDSASLMKRIMKEKDIEERDFPHKMILGAISKAKDAMISAAELCESAAQGFDLRRKIIGEAFLEYETRMKASNSLDFDDLILLTVRLFTENADVLEHYRKRFKHILVDEYQDTNNLQYLLASAIAGSRGNICVVGDDDQSIYKFRGATIENILNFEKHFKNARVIRLEQNYRSTGHILGAANDVIRNNRGRKAKKLWTDKEQGAKPELHVTGDERDEARFVADTIKASASEGRPWRSHAVLYRMNVQSNQIETAFKRSGVPYRVFGGTGFYDRMEVKDMLAYLCVIHNPHDDIRLLRIVNTPARGLGDTTIARLSAAAAGAKSSLFDAIKESHKVESLRSAAPKLVMFAAMIEELREAAASCALDELYEALLEKTGYARALELKGTDEAYARIDNVLELKTNIISFMNENNGSLFDFLNETALYTDLDRDKNADTVMLMTMHSAKGLEFDTVFVVGAEEGLFPGSRAIGEPGDMEEERRLCYVAMTRAMRKLYLTCARRRMIFGKTSSSQRSRFVGEISEENIETHDDSRGIGGFAGFGYYDYGDDCGDYDDYDDHTDSSIADSEPPDLPEPPGIGYPRRAPATVRPALRPGSATPPRIPQGRGAAHGYRAPAKGPAAPAPDLKKGDAVEHKAFGRGLVTSLAPGGGDVLIEVAFDGCGTKKLLLNSAAKFMKKI